MKIQEVQGLGLSSWVTVIRVWGRKHEMPSKGP